MRFGIGFANTGWYSSPQGAAELAAAAERAGFESLWTVDHIVVPAGYASEYPYSRSGRMAGGAEDFTLPDPLIWLASLVGRTETIRLATGVLILPLRNPLELAKATATLDHLSGGRVLFGVGAGWLAEEFEALGVPFGDRGDRTDEAIGALRALWTQDRASFQGRFTSFDDVYLRPQPVQQPIPVIVGGHSRRAARRAGELGDGFFPGSGRVDEVVRLHAHARRCAEAAGRDPDALELTVMARSDRASAEQWIEAGADRIVVVVPTIDEVLRYGEEVVAAFGP